MNFLLVDSGELQKVPFLYAEYIPRRNEQNINNFDPHTNFHGLRIGNIHSNFNDKK